MKTQLTNNEILILKDLIKLLFRNDVGEEIFKQIGASNEEMDLILEKLSIRFDSLSLKT